MRLLASLGLLVLCSASLAAGQVRVWGGTMRLPASDEGAPDQNPPFDLFSTKTFNYPYTIRDNVRNTESTHDWRAIYLENEFLKCSVLPDLGGHIYTCIDKINGVADVLRQPFHQKDVDRISTARGRHSALNSISPFRITGSHSPPSTLPIPLTPTAAPQSR